MVRKFYFYILMNEVKKVCQDRCVLVLVLLQQFMF